MCSGSPSTYQINGKDEHIGEQSSDDAAWIRANPGLAKSGNNSIGNPSEQAHLGDQVLGWQSVAPPTTPDLTDTALQSAKQGQLLSGLASTGYMATFIGK